MSYWADWANSDKASCFNPSVKAQVFKVNSFQKLKAWEPQGKLLAQWLELAPQILEVANAPKIREVLVLKDQREAAPIIWKLYLVGSKPRVDKLVPTILALHQDVDIARRGSAAFRELQNGPLNKLLWGFNIQYAEHSIKLCADKDEDMSKVNGSDKISLCGAPIAIQAQTSHSTTPEPAQELWTRATIGGSIVIKNKHYAMTAAHAFRRQPESSSDSAYPVFNIYTSADSIESSDLREHESHRVLPNVEESQQSRIKICSCSGKDTSTGHDEECIVLNQESDWALIPINNPQFTSSNVVQFMDGEKLHISGVIQQTPTGAVYALSSVTPPAPTDVASSPAIILLPGSTRLKLTWALPRRSNPGDCGSWVVNDEGQIFAMIVAVSELEGLTFCLPFANILDEIRSFFTEPSADLFGTRQNASAQPFARIERYKHLSPEEIHEVTSTSSGASEPGSEEDSDSETPDTNHEDHNEQDGQEPKAAIEEKNENKPSPAVDKEQGQIDDTLRTARQLDDDVSKRNIEKDSSTIPTHQAQVENESEQEEIIIEEEVSSASSDDVEVIEEHSSIGDADSTGGSENALYIDVIVDEENDLTTFMNQDQNIPIPEASKERLKRFGYVFDDKTEGLIVVEKALKKVEIEFILDSDKIVKQTTTHENLDSRARSAQIQRVKDHLTTQSHSQKSKNDAPADEKHEESRIIIRRTEDDHKERPIIITQSREPVQMQDTYSGTVLRFHKNEISPQALDHYHVKWRVDTTDSSHVQVTDTLTVERIKELKDYTKKHARPPSPTLPAFRRPVRQSTFHSADFDPDRQIHDSSGAALVPAHTSSRRHARERPRESTAPVQPQPIIIDNRLSWNTDRYNPDYDPYTGEPLSYEEHVKLVERQKQIAEACDLIDADFEMQVRNVLWDQKMPQFLCEDIIRTHSIKELRKKDFLEKRAREAPPPPPPISYASAKGETSYRDAGSRVKTISTLAPEPSERILKPSRADKKIPVKYPEPLY